MTTTESDIQKTVERALANLGNPSSWQRFRGYPNSLALCIIDSIQSLRLTYKTVGLVIDRYRRSRDNAGADPDLDGCTQLIDNIEAKGGVEGWSASIGTKNTSPGTKTLKAQAMLEAAIALRDRGIETNSDLRGYLLTRLDAPICAKPWLAVKGLGVASWDYLLMLAGEDGVKADTMIRRFVGKAIGTQPVSSDRAKVAVRAQPWNSGSLTAPLIGRSGGSNRGEKQRGRRPHLSSGRLRRLNRERDGE